ncbi:MAG: hypothetical protein DRI40_04620 [Chloroflexi bacterium]|nr:MAG: hypothetical protein DRI40_04620 [Chloroflexota bacterium]
MLKQSTVMAANAHATRANLRPTLTPAPLPGALEAIINLEQRRTTAATSPHDRPLPVQPSAGPPNGDGKSNGAERARDCWIILPASPFVCQKPAWVLVSS